MFDAFNKKKYLIIAGSCDFGRSLAENLTDSGALVYIHGNKRFDLLNTYKNSIKHDFLEDNIEDFFKKLAGVEFNGFISFLGKAYYDFSKKMTEKRFKDCIDLNLSMNALLLNRIQSQLSNDASIVLCSSPLAKYGETGMSHYAAAKSGLTGLMRSYMKELSHKRIRVNCISPYLIETAATKKLPLKKREDYLNKNPLKRLGKPEDVSHLVLFLLSDFSSYINGQEISVSGGHEFIA